MRPIYMKITAFGPYGGTEEIDFSQLGASGIYLVTGPTGSGKTSIFDAICFALFGKTSSGEREAKDLQSQHRQDDMPTEVVLVFEVRGAEYKVVRGFKRTKKRGTGVYEFSGNQTVELEIPNEPAITNLRAADSKLQEILGLDFDKFTKIVMLAQNKFQKFLTADSKDRSQLFASIFDTSLYRTITDNLKAECSKTRATRDTQQTELNTSLASGSASGSQHEAEFAAARERGVYGAADALAVLEQVVDDDEAQLAKVEDSLKEIDRRKTAIAKRKSRSDMLSEVASRLDAAKKAHDVAAERLPKLEQQHVRWVETQPQIDDMRGRIAIMRNGLSAYDRLERIEKELADTRKEAGEFAKAAEQAKACRDSSVKAAEQARTKLTAIEAAVEQKRKCDDRVQTLQSWIDGHIDLENACSDLKKAALAYSERVEEYEEASALLDQRAGEALQIERLYLDSQAGVLASKLADGKPCPVCGSVEHPHLAAATADAPSQEELDSARELEGEARRDAVEKSNAASAARAKVVSDKSALSKLCGKPEWADSAMSNLTAPWIVRDGDESGVAGTSANAAMNSGANASAGGASPEVDLQTLHELLQTSERERGKLEDELEQLQRESLNLGKLASKAPETRQGLANAEHDIETFGDALAKADAEAKSRSAKAEQIEKQLGESRASLEHDSKAEAEAAISALVQKADGMEAEAAKAAKALADCQAGIAQTQSAIAENEQLLKGQVIEDSKALEAEETAVGAEHEQADKLKTALASRISSNRNVIKSAGAKLSEFERTDERLGLLKVLCDTADGTVAGSDRIALETYVQTVFFDQMIVLANQRLATMSGGRYEFVRGKGEGGGQHGLELDVRDNDTGGIRPVSTFSGGESFMASMSLALGLSDTVQNNAGGIGLDCMFIDEGFGTLDDDLLDLVIEVLSRISANDKLIGIISHVGELKQAIPNKLVVEKCSDGSHVSLQLG